MTGSPIGFQYVVLRWVPRAEREEFLNVGVVLHCPDTDYLRGSCEVDERRLLAVDPQADLDELRESLETIERVCRGDESAGPAAGLSPRQRFGWLAAPRSTVVRAGPVHGGMTSDPDATLRRLAAALVG